MNLEEIVMDVALLGAAAFMVAFFYLKIREMIEQSKRPRKDSQTA